MTPTPPASERDGAVEDVLRRAVADLSTRWNEQAAIDYEHNGKSHEYVELRRELSRELIGLLRDHPVRAAREDRPDLRATLIADVRALGYLTPEEWDERRGGDPIARTVNAVEDIIQARFDEARSMAEERVREAHAGSQSARSSAALRSSAAGLDAAFALPLPELGCDCGACRYLSRKQAEAHAARLAAPQAAPKTQEEAG